MPVFEIRPVSLSNGEFAAAWFDDESALWNDERLHKPESLLVTWQVPRLRLWRPERGATPALFNPNAYAVSAEVRSALAHCSGVEFLPVEIAGFGTFFILHVVEACEVPEGCSLRRAPPPSGNIVELFSFPVSYAPGADFFRLLQPQDLAAAGFIYTEIYVSIDGARAVEDACGRYLSAREVGGTVPR